MFMTILIIYASGCAIYLGSIFWRHNAKTITKAVDKVEADVKSDVTKTEAMTVAAKTALVAGL